MIFLYETDTNPSCLGEKLQRLPTSLSESLVALNEDNVMTDLIGEKLLVAIKGIRKVCLFYILLILTMKMKCTLAIVALLQKTFYITCQMYLCFSTSKIKF